MLPNVKIDFANGLLGAVGAMADGVAGLISTAVAVTQTIDNVATTTFALNTPYKITKLDDLIEKGINSSSTGANANLYKCVKEFYDEAPVGSELWIMGVADTMTIDKMVDKTEANGALKLLRAANGDIRVLIVKVTDAAGYTATVTHAIDEKVETAITKAQQLCEELTTANYAPVFAILEGRHYNGTASSLPALNEGDDNRVAVVIGDTVANSTGAAVGLLAGRIAAIPVQRSVARVRTGSIGATKMYISTTEAENGDAATINDKGFICPRTFVGKAGYFWSDDKLATAPTDDYALIPRRRTIDKAYRIAYQTLVNELNDEVPVTDEGKIAPPYVKAVQTAVESAVINLMTSEGNLGVDPSDPNDMGVQCYIDPDQNIVATSKLKVKLRVKPYGYAKYIEVDLGFKVSE